MSRQPPIIRSSRSTPIPAATLLALAALAVAFSSADASSQSLVGSVTSRESFRIEPDAVRSWSARLAEAARHIVVVTAPITATSINHHIEPDQAPRIVASNPVLTPSSRVVLSLLNLPPPFVR